MLNPNLASRLPSHADNSPADKSYPDRPLRLEVYAQYERHMQECDALIADRIGCAPAYWARQREEKFVYWEHEYARALAMPPRRDPAAFAPGEYLRWSERMKMQRHPHPAAGGWEWLGWALVLVVTGIFFGERIPGVHDFVAEMLKGVLR